MSRPAPPSPVEQSQFVTRWNQLERRDRSRIRRLVRLGRPVANVDEALLAVAYGRFQLTRVWTRWFWLWFVPGLAAALSIAATLHPIALGIVLALAAQAVLARRNLTRITRVNQAFLR